MDLGSIFLILAVLLLVGLFVTRPLLARQDSQPVTGEPVTDHELSSLLAERDRVLTALQELDFDYTLGKIPEEDYPSQRARMLEYGAGILRQIDQLRGEEKPPSGEQDEAEERLEAAIAARKLDGQRRAPGLVNGAGVVPAKVASPDDELEVALANRRRARQGKAAGFCPNCGSAVQRSDKFCPRCGHNQTLPVKVKA
jgi:hypothetical protein